MRLFCAWTRASVAWRSWALESSSDSSALWIFFCTLCCLSCRLSANAPGSASDPIASPASTAPTTTRDRLDARKRRRSAGVMGKTSSRMTGWGGWTTGLFEGNRQRSHLEVFPSKQERRNQSQCETDDGDRHHGPGAVTPVDPRDEVRVRSQEPVHHDVQEEPDRTCGQQHTHQGREERLHQERQLDVKTRRADQPHDADLAPPRQRRQPDRVADLQYRGEQQEAGDHDRAPLEGADPEV